MVLDETSRLRLTKSEEMGYRRFQHLITTDEIRGIMSSVYRSRFSNELKQKKEGVLQVDKNLRENKKFRKR